MNKWVFLVICVLLLVVIVVCSVFLADTTNKNSVFSGYVQEARRDYGKKKFSFMGWYKPKADLSAVNACADGNENVECVDDSCSNCMCPNVCKLRQKPFMMMDNQDGNTYRCSCGNSLEELVETSTAIDVFSIPSNISQLGDVWEKANTWQDTILPPTVESTSQALVNTGAGGVYPESSMYWTVDALNKVFIGKYDTSAVYFNPAVSTTLLRPSDDFGSTEFTPQVFTEYVGEKHVGTGSASAFPIKEGHEYWRPDGPSALYENGVQGVGAMSALQFWEYPSQIINTNECQALCFNDPECMGFSHHDTVLEVCEFFKSIEGRTATDATNWTLYYDSTVDPPLV